MSQEEFNKALLAAQQEFPPIHKTKTAKIETQKGSYCIGPATRILTADLRWTEAQKLSIGDRLVAFDEEPPGHQRPRHWRTATVDAIDPVQLPTYRTWLADGSVVDSSDTHRWLIMEPHGWQHWCDTESLSGQTVVKVMEPWEDDDRSWEAGYLAAAFDGEGSLCQSIDPRGRFQFHLVFTQNPGAMLDRVEALLESLAVTVRRYAYPTKGTVQLRVGGSRNEAVRFLGMVCPTRLVNRLDAGRLGAMRKVAAVPVTAQRFLGNRQLIALKTSTATFVAEGFASHNSYKYADLGDVLESVLPILHKHGIALSQPPIWAPGQVGVQTKLVHESGLIADCGELMLSAGNTPQSAGSAMTYVRRYAACAALGIVADEDDDGRSTLVPESDYVETPDFTEEIRQVVSEFTEWDDDKKRAEWIRATAAVGNGRPKTLDEVNTIAKQVREFYAEYLDKLTEDES